MKQVVIGNCGIRYELASVYVWSSKEKKDLSRTMEVDQWGGLCQFLVSYSGERMKIMRMCLLNSL